MKKILSILVIILLATSVFAKKKAKAKGDSPKGAPEWVLNPSAQFPASQYLAQVGEGRTTAQAQIDAINNLASVFGQSVHSTTASAHRMAQASVDGKVANVDVSTIGQDVARKVSVDDLVGVEIKETFNDGAKWHAIAVLDKAATAMMYENMLLKNNATVKSLVGADASNTRDFYSFENYAKLDFARDVAKKDDMYLSRLQVLNSARASAIQKDMISEKQITPQLIEISKNIPIAVFFDNDTGNRFASAFAKVVSDAGFRTSDLTGERYVVKGKVSYDAAETKDGKSVNCRWTVDASLVDNSVSTTLLPFNISGRDAGVDFDGAKNKSVKKIESKILEEFKKAFDDYLASIVAY